LTEKVTEQEQRIASLETQVEDLQSIATNAKTGLSQLRLVESTRTPSQGPEIASTGSKNDVRAEQAGKLLSVRDFAEKIGMAYTTLDGYSRRGICGEKLDITEIPHSTRKGYTNKFFTLEQQEKAVALLKKHGKLTKEDNYG
jgi:hypothetical protein